MVIWLTGLSGSGKSAIGGRVYALLKENNPATVWVDGDQVRKVLGLDQSDSLYTLQGRRMVAGRIHGICAWLDEQGIDIVCSTISLFDEIHAMNKKTFSRYYEVFIDVPMEVLKRRDTKNLYGPALRGEISNVMGVDLPFAPPEDPNQVIDNSIDGADLDSLARSILAGATALSSIP